MTSDDPEKEQKMYFSQANIKSLLKKENKLKTAKIQSDLIISEASVAAMNFAVEQFIRKLIHDGT